MRRPLGLILALGLAPALGACSSDVSPSQKAVSVTEDHLGDIRSGELSLRLLASTADATPDRGVGFALQGQFAVSSDVGSLPVADLRYTRITGATRRSTRFISTGRRAFAEVDGRIVPLNDDDVNDMRVRGGKAAGKGGLEGLDLTKWFDDAEIADGSPVDGAATERITGTVDPVAALNDLLSLSLRFGASEQESPRTLSGGSADRVRDAVSSATAELVTGKTDRLLRQLQVEIVMKPDADQEKLRSALGDLVGTRLEFILDVSKLNSPVNVAEPR